MAASGDITLEQLKKQLEKSEAGRAKLRESLGLLREKALNTGELLRQHRVLKEKYEITVGELEEEKTAREEAGAEVRLAKQSVVEAAKGTKSVGEQMRGCKTQAAAAQKAANDASKAVAGAAKAQSATQSDVTILKQEVSTLRAQLQQLKSRQPSRDSTQSATQATAVTAALHKEVTLLRQCVTRLKQQQQEHIQERRSQQEADARSDAAARVQQLEVEVAAQNAEQHRIVLEMGRWRSMFGSFAAAMGGDAAAAALPSSLQNRPPWTSGIPTEVREASVREGSNVPAVPPHGSTSAGNGVYGRGTRQRLQAPDIAVGRDASGPAASQTLYQKLLQSTQDTETRHDQDSSHRHHHQSAAGSATELGAFAPKRMAEAAQPLPTAKRIRRSADSSASESSTDASLGLDGEDSDEWEGEEGDTAADIVQMALGRLTRWKGRVPSLHTADEVSQVLVAALLSGRAPMSSVVAGFETAVLECAGHLGGVRPTSAASDDAATVVSALNSGAESLMTGGNDAVSVAALKLLPVWCGSRAGHPCAFALVLHCAAMVASRLQSSSLREVGAPVAATTAFGDTGAGEAGFQERLRAHLHSATAQAGGTAGSGTPRYFPTEACAAAAAAMVLARQLGNIQAARVLVWDLVGCWRRTGIRGLPALASALDAWPTCLPPFPSGHESQPGRHSQPSAPPQVAAVHEALQSSCSPEYLPSGGDGGPLSDDALSVASPAISLLRQLGRSVWQWPPQSFDQCANEGV